MTNLTKDELAIMHTLIAEHKYTIYKKCTTQSTGFKLEMIDAIEALEEKCLNLSNDNRRNGITYHDTLFDVVKRLVKKNKK